MHIIRNENVNTAMQTSHNTFKEQGRKTTKRQTSLSPLSTTLKQSELGPKQSLTQTESNPSSSLATLLYARNPGALDDRSSSPTRPDSSTAPTSFSPAECPLSQSRRAVTVCGGNRCAMWWWWWWAWSSSSCGRGRVPCERKPPGCCHAGGCCCCR